MPWQITLSSPPPIDSSPSNITVFDFDLFENPASTVDQIHTKSHYAICYFSAGSYEAFRPDKDQFNPNNLGKPLNGWFGERWLDTTSDNVRRIMRQRMDQAKSKGCDAIDPDNIDAYDNDNGLELTTDDAVDYVKFLADEGHSRGMAVGLKNGGAIVQEVLSDVDFEVNEQCVQYGECATFRPFIDAGKPVFNIEYIDGTPSSTAVDKICASPTRRDFSTLVKHMDLGDFSRVCSGSAQNTSSTEAAAAKSTASTNNDSSASVISVHFGTILLAIVLSFLHIMVCRQCEVTLLD